MSPLARSLLALVALHAAADAVYENCGLPGLLIGTESPFPVNLSPMPIDVPPPGGRIALSNDCSYLDNAITGVRVRACNKDPYGLPPYLSALDPYNLLTYVDIYCPDGCPYGAKVYIQQYCLYQH